MNKIICGVDVSKDWLDAMSARRRSTGALRQRRGRHRRTGRLLPRARGRAGGDGGLRRLRAAGLRCCCGSSAQPCARGSTRATCAASPRRWASWRRPTGSTPASSPTMPRSRRSRRRRRRARPSSGSRRWFPGFRQVTGDLTVHKQRRAAARNAETLDSIDEIIALLKRQIAAVEGEIASLIDDDPLWARLDAAFRASRASPAAPSPPDGEVPEIGTDLQQGHRQARRPRPDRQRQRQAQGPPPGARRPRRRRAPSSSSSPHRRPLRPASRRLP